MQESYVKTADGVRLFVRTLGSGPRTLIIPNAAWLFDDFQHLAEGRTLVSYDLRHRGRSDAVTDPLKLHQGVHHDVEDLESIRQHVGAQTIDILGHSYLGVMVILYAMKHAEHVNRVIQIGPAQPDASKQYPVHLTGADATLAEISAQLAALQVRLQTEPTAELQDQWRATMRRLFVIDPANADRVAASGRDLPNERNLRQLMMHISGNIMPSLFNLQLTPEQIAAVTAPVLTIHGTRDRQAPYGGGRDWAALLPNARLITVENAAHLPWIEAPEQVFEAIRVFLDGAWPAGAEQITSAA